jgi:hypothetical protein
MSLWPQFIRAFQSSRKTTKPKTTRISPFPTPRPFLLEALEARSLLTAITVGSGPWNDPSVWQSGLIPVAGDDVIISAGHNVTYNDTTPDVLASLTIDGKLAFSPSLTLELKSKGNIQVTDTGELEMRPLSVNQAHTVTFVAVDESKFVGANGPAGGMVVVASDVGLWVTGGGILDTIGSEKTSWTNLTGSATAGQTTITVADASGWRVGDAISIAPTIDPTFTNSWSAYDERTITAVSGNTITLNSALTYAHPMVNNTWTAEVLNLTRNVVIQGTAPDTVAHRAHIEFLMTTKAQTMRNVELRYMGPKVNGSLTAGTGIFGRYALHFHHAMDGSVGSLIENIVAHDIGNHVFVPHASNGITFKGTVSHNTYDDAYWWDVGAANASNDIVFDAAVASKIVGSGSTATRVAGFQLGGGTGNVMKNSVAVGNGAGNLQSAGIEWPEESGGSVWEFHNNITHNNRLDGVFTWQNAFSALHLVDNLASYYNAQYGIQHGAYVNVYVFDHLSLYGNKLANFFLHAAAADGLFHPLTIQNSTINGAGISPVGIEITKHTTQATMTGATNLLNNTITNLATGGKAIYFSYTAVAQHPGDIGVDMGSLPTQWYDPPYPGPGNSSSHREWFNITNTNFGNVPLANQIYVTGYWQASDSTPHGIMADSDILVKTLDGAVYNLRSYHFNKTFTADFYKPTYETTSEAAWRWFWVQSSVGSNLTSAAIVSGEGTISARDTLPGTQMFTLKQFQAIDTDQTVQLRLTENLATGGLIARKSDDDESTYYKATVGNAAGGNILTIWKVVDGIATALTTAPVNVVNGVNYKIRFSVTTNGAATDLKAKVWDASTAEPGTWSAQALGDTEARLQKVYGRYGIIGTAAGANPTVFDNYSGTILDSITFDPNQNGYVQSIVAPGTPQVNVGSDKSTALWSGGNAIFIDATVIDAGITNPTTGVTYAWSKVTGPGAVTFSNPAKIDTYAAFASPGLYTLRLVASDGTLSGKDDIHVYVAPSKDAQITESFTGTTGAPWPSAWTNYQLTGAVSQTTITAAGQGMVRNPVIANSDMVSFNSGLQAENVDVYATINLGYSAIAGLVTRNEQGSPGTFLSVRVGMSTLKFYMVVDGIQTLLSTGPALSNAQATDYRVRFQTITNSDGSIDMRVKIWLASLPSEPTPWTHEFLGWKSPQSERFVGRAGQTGILANQMVFGNAATYRVLFDDFKATSLDAGATLIPNAFSDTFTGSSGAWSPSWSFVGPWPLTNLSSNTGHIQAGSATQAGSGSYNGASFIDSTQEIMFQAGTNGAYFGLFARRPSTGLNTSADKYYTARTGTIGTSGNANTLYIQKIIGTTPYTLGQINLGQYVSQGNWYHLMFDVATLNSTTTQLRAKLWKDGDPMPIAWNLTLNDTTATLQNYAGQTGFLSSLTANAHLYVDNYALNYV